MLHSIREIRGSKRAVSCYYHLSYTNRVFIVHLRRFPPFFLPQGTSLSTGIQLTFTPRQKPSYLLELTALAYTSYSLHSAQTLLALTTTRLKVPFGGRWRRLACRFIVTVSWHSGTKATTQTLSHALLSLLIQNLLNCSVQ